MILVIGSPDDLRVQATLHQMESSKVDYCLFDTITYPYDIQITQTIDSPLCGAIRIGDRKVPANEIQSVYYCVQSGFQTLADDPPEIRSIIYNNIDSAAWSFVYSLESLFVNPIEPANMHNYKAFILKQMRANQIRVPHTMVTNEPEAVIAFYHQMGGNVIYKPPWGQSFTAKLTENELQPAHLSKLSHSPIMLQEYIPGSEVRAYVIGNEVFGVKVESDEVDINMDSAARRVRFDLPDHVVEMALKVSRVTELVFTAIDMRVSHEGEYVVLEANSSPDFTADQYQTGYPLCQTLIEMLERGSVS
jgi:glutathione synthase/RimK-type ligase-like ATP-grasp enzyme